MPESPFPDSFRPDRLKVIIVPLAWRGRRAFLLKSAGADPDAGLLQWMQNFSMQSYTPFFYEQAGEKLGFGPPEFLRDMMLRAERGEAMW